MIGLGSGPFEDVEEIGVLLDEFSQRSVDREMAISQQHPWSNGRIESQATIPIRELSDVFN